MTPEKKERKITVGETQQQKKIKRETYMYKKR